MASGFSKYRIINGPAKFDLVISIFHGDSRRRNTVSFHLDEAGPGITLRVFIDGINREDDSGDKWILRGRIFRGVELPPFGYPRFEASFSTQDRKGWMKIFNE